jgi:hypothetical protein
VIALLAIMGVAIGKGLVVMSPLFFAWIGDSVDASEASRFNDVVVLDFGQEPIDA